MDQLTARPWLASYADGVPAEIEPVTQTLVDMLDDAVARYPRRPALEFFGAVTTYRELGEQVARAAAGLWRLGVRAGDRVALILPNAPQHVVAFYAAQRLGAIVVEHNPRYTPPELRHLFEVHHAKVAIVWDAVADVVAEFPSDIRPQHIVAVTLPDAMPWRLRALLRLPVRSAREKRAALTARPTAKGILPWAKLGRRRLPKAASLAGEKRALLTLWPVADDGTADFMVRYYEHLKGGETYAQALRSTRRDAIDGKIPTAKDPLVWAAFVLFEN